MLLLHTNKLHLKHIFASLDGLKDGLDTVSVPIEKKLHGSVSVWPVTNSKQLLVPMSFFPTPSPHVVNDLSTNQFCAYKILYVGL